MNKAEIVQKLYAHKELAHLKKTEIELMINEFVSLIKLSVKKGHDVSLVGFGTFTKSKRKARLGRNPQTGATLKIPARSVPKFKAGKDFREVVR